MNPRLREVGNVHGFEQERGIPASLTSEPSHDVGDAPHAFDDFGHGRASLVDDFHETIDIILKPMAGVLAGLSAYSGSALMGDGSVLMVLNVREML